MTNAAIATNECQTWRDNLALVEQLLPFVRRVVHAGDAIYEGGAPFGHLYLINSGQFKTVNFTADGRGQVVGLHFRGDWLGFDGIADGHYGCDAIALDTGEVWSVRYADVLVASTSSPELMRLMHTAMSRQIGRGHRR
jgi:CRP/FNR family transcriptional regulator, anaerobic regulatory protein